MTQIIELQRDGDAQVYGIVIQGGREIGVLIRCGDQPDDYPFSDYDPDHYVVQSVDPEYGEYLAGEVYANVSEARASIEHFVNAHARVGTFEAAVRGS